MSKNLEKLSAALIYAKNDYQINHLFADEIIEELEKKKIQTKLILIDQDNKQNIDLTNYDIIINRSRFFEFLVNFKNKRHVFNQPEFTKMANDKYLTYKWAKYNNIRCLKTDLFQNKEIKNYKFPVVIKQRDGHGGKEVFKFNNSKDLEENNLINEKYVVQEFFKQAKSDIRVYVMFKKIIAVIKRTAKNDEFRSNLSIGGKVEKYHLSLSNYFYVRKIINDLPDGYYGLDFFKKSGKLILNEVEDVVGSRSLYKLKKNLNIPKLLVKKIIKKLKKANHFQNEFFSKINY